MTQGEKAERFFSLHQPGNPLIVFNVWDAGGAKAVADAGAKAIGTSSWSVAAAHGYDDGQAVPLDLVLTLVSRIAVQVDTPLTVDFEGAYAQKAEIICENVAGIIRAGAVGINFEDRIVEGSGLYPTIEQCARIKAAISAGQASALPFFVNARTDLFLREGDRSKHGTLLNAAAERAMAYADAGASGFFVPGLIDPDLIGSICETAPIPVNVMMTDGCPPIHVLASLGVARISYGPGPYVEAMQWLANRFVEISAPAESGVGSG